MTLFKSKQTEPDPASAALDYLLRERVSAQWMAFLQALSAELLSQLAPEEFHALLRSVGLRMAHAAPLAQVEDSITGLEHEINRTLAAMRWGQAKLTDDGAVLRILLHFNPLPPGLGVDPAVAAGALEGLFQGWFQAAGADPSLVLTLASASTDGSMLEFSYGPQ